MINESLQFITTELHNYLQNIFPSNEPLVIVSNLINADSTVPININNKLVVCLLNIDQEVSATNVGFSKTTQTGGSSNINLEIVLAANFSNYTESLKMIDAALSFFQNNNVFHHQNFPTLPQNVTRLSLELINLSPEDANFVWNTLGVKYMPSLIYKIKVEAADPNRVIASPLPYLEKK